MRMRDILTAAIVGSSMLAGPVMAQAPGPPPPDATLRDCHVEPGQQPGGQAQADGDQKLSDVLEKCRGVLRPPATGDGKIVEPPPDTGKTPVIPPDALPQQQQPQPK